MQFILKVIFRCSNILIVLALYSSFIYCPQLPKTKRENKAHTLRLNLNLRMTPQKVERICILRPQVPRPFFCHPIGSYFIHHPGLDPLAVLAELISELTTSPSPL